MFIFTTKLTRRKAVVFILIVAAILCGLIFLAGSLDSRSGSATSASITGIDSNEDRVALLESYGWQVKPEPVETLEITLPRSFDDTYARYNDIQKAQGFDLSDYTGKRVKRFSYEILNYPGGETGVMAHLVVYKSSVIAGDVASTELSGFMHGLAVPEP